MSKAAKKSILLSFYTLISRILGLVRDHLMAVHFGNGMVASAFSVAYRLPNMFRNLLAEGTLSQSFMPIYTEFEKESEESARVMSGAVISFLFFFLTLFAAGFIFAGQYFIPYLVGGTQEYSVLVVNLTQILFFLIITASLSSIFMAISYTKNRYFVPSLSPIILNLTYISVFLIAFPFFDGLVLRAQVLSIGVILGGILQLFVQMIYVYRCGIMPKLRFNFSHPAIRKIFQLMLPAVIGGGFYQISLLVDIFLANYVQNHYPGIRAVVSLDYSQRLVQLPTGIIGVALATTILPSLLQSMKEEKDGEIAPELSSALAFASFLTFPAAIGMAILRIPILDSIFYGGRWDSYATKIASGPLLFYAFAVPVYSMNKILVSSYYAFQDTKTPLRTQTYAFGFNIVLNFSLLWILLHKGIALASALSSTFTFFALLFQIKKHGIVFPWKSFGSRISQLVLPLLILSLWLWGFMNFLYDPSIEYLRKEGLGFANSSRITLSAAIGPAILFYFLIGWWTQVPDLLILSKRFLRK